MDTESALRALGFSPGKSFGFDSGYEYGFGEFVLRAFEVTSRYMRPVWIFSGVRSSTRSIEEIWFEVPLQVESIEQAQAWIAYGAFRGTPSSQCPEWIEEGRRCAHLLPWMRQQEAYKRRPQCEVTRDWLRLAIGTLVSIGTAAEATEECVVFFDGAVLTFQVAGQVVPMPATGLAWPRAVVLEIESLRRLPKRLMSSDVLIDIWEGHLRVGNRAFRLKRGGDEGV